MIIEKLEALCKENNTTLTALCKEITGSSGNLPTWKKDNIRPEWLRKICLKFNITSDYLLDLPSSNNITEISMSQELSARFDRLKPDYKIKSLSYMIDLYEKQQLGEPLDSTGESVVADEPLGKTGTDMGK